MSIDFAPGAATRHRMLKPSTWPVRWRLALASAGFTLAILLVFAGVVGNLAGQRLRSDFNDELNDSTIVIARQIRIFNAQLVPGLPSPTAESTLVGPDLDDIVRANDASVRVFDVYGNLIGASRGSANLGPPRIGTYEVGPYRVAGASIRDPQTNFVTGVVQYGRNSEHIDETISRLWLLIAVGVCGGTLLATLAGLAIAGRAMRPIASLTATARQISATRDPSRHMPQPDSEDEVAELARTLEHMLRSLDSARAEREDAMQKQREFVADASHELRTPLTSVMANLELLQVSLRDQPESEEGEMVDSALRSSRRMSRLVADLLILARADAGRVSRRSRCDIAEIAGNAAAEVAVVAGERSLRVEDGRPIPVEGNPDELHRMVLNLLDNAVRHTPEGTRIELRLDVDTDRGEAWIEVADDGPGIPADQRPQVFGRFVRGGGPADTAAGTGTGLGLSIVRAVARSHGGDVEIADSPRGGALFRVRLPIAESEEAIKGSLRPV